MMGVGASTGSLTEDSEGGVDILCNVRYSFSELTVICIPQAQSHCQLKEDGFT